MDHLLLEREGNELAAVPLGLGGLEVGSAPGNGLRLRGADVRPYHLVLRRRRRRWWAVGRGGELRLESGEPVSAVALEPGTAVRLGPYVLSIASERRAEPTDDAPPRDRTRPLGGADLPPAAAVALRWLDHDGRPELHRLGHGETVLGRHPACDLVVPEASVSSRHARIVTDADGAVLEDLASLNGCWLDGRRIWLAGLEAGAALRLGSFAIEVLDSRGAPAAGARRAAPRPVFPPGLGGALEALGIAARSAEPCVLLGETGSGKEVLARRLHELGPRRQGPFVAVNAAALPRELAESVLFGHRRGAFTGAVEPHRGAFERASGGTLLLDEVGETAPEIQAKLLRVLEESRVLPVGGERPIEIDVRVVAATNRDLIAAVRAGRFRLDLWHRLAVFVVHIPPLRERPGDIAPLVEAILAGAAGGGVPCRATERALAALRGHSWPGNVRELRNVLLRCVATAVEGEIGEAAVRRAMSGDALLEAPAERRVDVEELLETHAGNVSAAARAAGVPRSTFRDLMRQGLRGRPGGTGT
ncbi:MAG: sigma 54-interacting transcriptional regulator [Deltaproteobacteria bacterium]|nr:sigma 54-interacting transcriptional regulator [Deltaproteobacteria bacterium]